MASLAEIWYSGCDDDLVRILHDNNFMEAEVFVAGESARIQVPNGLRQRYM